MAAAGGGGPGGPGTGGKIRSRRYHLSSGRTPYSKSRQQQQGIISRVTDTVKSIVPGWLQKYFNKQEEEHDRVHSASEVIVNDTEARENNAEHHIYVVDDDDDEEGNSPTDGRVTPEPIINVDEEVPSTSQSAINNTDALTRPSLHRASLNFNIFDSPALNCQPSTSSAFPIGTSGFSLIKEIKDSTSQHDDDNISTTSGFSSRASDKDLAVSKNVSVPPLWSPEVDRSQSLSHNSSMTSKKPTFNLSAFGSLSPSLGNASILNRQLGDSPFYPGKTTYQGAAAVRSSRVRATPYQAPLRRQVKAKPAAHSQQCGVTSSAARRILQSLEKMSSPLADAKRIPSNSSLSHTPEKNVMDIPENPSKRKKVESPFPPVQRLVTPKSISVSANRSLYIKPSLTPSAVSNTNSRRIQPDKHNESRKNNLQTTSQSHSFSYPKFSTPASNGLSSGTGGGKMMREKGSHYSTKPANEELDGPVLPEIPLPLSTAALPSFQFSTLSGSATSPISVTKPANSTTCRLTSSSPSFTFSSPIVKSTESNAQSPGSSVDFTFSVPAAKASSATSDESKVSAVSRAAKTHAAVSSAKNTDDEQLGFCKPAKTLKEGSVLDMLRSPGFSSSPSLLTSASSLNRSTPTLSKTVGNTFSPANVSLGVGSKQAFGLWQCSACFHENMSSDSNCISCSALKPRPTETSKKLPASPPSSNTKSTVPLSSTPGLGDIFKKPAGMWDCDTCLVQNKAEVTKCVACETPKPGTGMKATLLIPSTTKSTNPATNTLAFASCSASIPNEEMFKKPMGSWECTVCHMQNKTEDNTCVGCKAEKPGTVKSVPTAAPSGLLGLLDQFKKPTGSWDCDVCLIQNKPEANKCIACESAKPGTKAELKGTFDTVKNSVSVAPLSSGQLGLLDQFKKSAGSWDCDVCLVENKPEATKCVACETSKPGTKAELKGFGTSTFSSGTAAPTFKFGVQSSDSTAELKSGASTSGFAKSIGNFKFGLASASTTTEETGKKSFTFGSSTTNEVSAGFKFGIAGSAQTKPDTLSQSTTSGFTFGSVSNTVSLAPTATSSGSTGLQVAAVIADSNLATTATLKSAEEKKAEAPTITPFSFGKTDQNKETASTSFVFGKKDEKTDSAPTGSSFAFGLKKDGEESKQFLFGKPEPTKVDGSAASAGFAFGVTNPTEKKDIEQPGKSVFAFGAQTSITDAGASKQPFSFLTNVSSTAASSSTCGVSSSVFGSVTQSSTPATPSNVFGSAISANAPAPSSGVFGNLTPSNAPAASSTLFGNVAPSSTPSGSSGLFGTAAASSTPATSTSLFGSAAKLSAPASSGGVFNSAAPAAPASTASSVFGSVASSTNTSANSANIFGSSGGAATAPGAFVFGQPASTASTVFGNSSESKSTFVFSGQENKPVTSASTSVTPFLFGAVSASTTPAAPGFNFGRTITSNTTGTSSSPFIFGAGASGSASSSITAQANPVPAFGQSSNPSTAPAFGSSTSVPVFPAGNSQQVPAFGSSSAQPPVFGQQATQPSFGSPAAPSAGSGFPFGNNANFNFNSTNSSGGVFTFNANSGSTTQPPPPGYMFNAAAPGFNMGTNGRTTPASTISTRKIKTARRRK
ncbi:nuclear pore complex protein Nup153 [Xenopus laevis]|uniref:Nuclear pore complex protein Nup153 n=1 Tax=Xenopus laevis TaxID=8355 RepID=NU153_XENLA|nr:nuclear pore complex protein Nup153 [Xenopus laevis]Q640Z6.1 RecName: Full=Nuclear pore complex protein Nup153; AltName: Full=153 kDa nucleoporin; AltName: Full=Nucleoporin Nup153 [Xenopus laevis]AAH82443.1 NUP153 protein [Xenopus laevis]